MSKLKLYKPNGQVHEVSTSWQRHMLLDRLPEFLRNFETVNLSYGFSIETGVSLDTHIFVTRENHSYEDPACLMDVFALEVGAGGAMTNDEVFNSAHSTYGFSGEERGSLTAYYYANDCSEGGSKCVGSAGCEQLSL